jgi:hypothetical protein
MKQKDDKSMIDVEFLQEHDKFDVQRFESMRKAQIQWIARIFGLPPALLKEDDYLTQKIR